MEETQHLLRRIAAGDDGAQARLFELVYEELHQRAAALMRHQDAAHTLQPTALVNEAWLRLVHVEQASFADRRHFVNTATAAMRSVLVDHARAKLSAKRGAGRRVGEAALEVADRSEPSWRFLALDEALERLERSEPEAHRVAQLRLFGGLNHSEIAEHLGVTPRTVERHWATARGRLAEALGEQQRAEPGS